uniref:SFRICE_031125 n=1 Tax=Spodoptera frugiperda TaxID=7108 RepID=A0A2H1X168_SPOFR
MLAIVSEISVGHKDKLAGLVHLSWLGMEHHPMTSLALGKALSAIFHERPLSTTALAITSVIGQVPINNTLTTQPVWKTTQGLYCGCTNCITRVPVLFLHTLADEDTPAKLLEKTWTSGQGQSNDCNMEAKSITPDRGD